MAKHTEHLHAAVLRKRALAKLLGVSQAHIDRLRAKNEFPAPIRLGEQAVGWRMDAIESWLDSRPVVQH